MNRYGVFKADLSVEYVFEQCHSALEPVKISRFETIWVRILYAEVLMFEHTC